MKKLVLTCLLFSALLPGQTAADFGLQIPSSHPRVWWTPERLTQARAWYAANPFTPRSDDYLGQAFRYLMTGERQYARSAIDYAMTVELATSGVASNGARWYGEIVILTYDWCYDQMTATERATLRDRWNGYLEALRLKDWGGPTMPQSNYFWGYLRNQIEWALATWYENPMAATFLNDALVTRWQNAFMPQAASLGRGGVLVEGSQYGPYLIDYATVPFRSAGLMGRNLFEEGNFFREAVYYIIYSTPTAPTALRSDGSLQWDLFPFADDEQFRNGGSAEGGGWSNFMLSVADLWRNDRIGQHARRWHRTVGGRTAAFIAATDRGGAEADLAGLPLDYYAPGAGFLFTKTAWTPGATVAHLQLGYPNDDHAHTHYDYGNWQMWRGGRWLSRETTGYAHTLAGYGGATAEARDTVAHNGILVGGRGLATAPVNGPPVVKRVESRPEYTYGATDLTASYRNNEVQWARPERDNAAVSHVEREFLFIRPLETMVVFDRVESATASATKTFLAHFEQQPRVDGANAYLGVNGDQALRVTTLVPSAPVYRVITEGGIVGQYRLEVETSGQTLSYFLHVLQARDSSGQNVTAQVSETAAQYIVTLQHPTRGHARVVFNKGQATNGGGFAYSASAPPSSVNPLLDRVQAIQVTNSGPAWEALSGGAPVPTTPADTTAPVISAVAASAIGSSSATITWTTNEAADGQVEYGTSSSYGQTSPLAGSLAAAHSVTLAGLSPGTTYSYRVRSRDAAGNVAVSPGATFRTGAATAVYTITASTTPGASIAPSGAVTLSAGASQSFAIAPATGYEISDVLVNNASVGPVTSYTFNNVNSNQTIGVSCRLRSSTQLPSGGASISVPVTVHAYSAGNGPANLVSNALPLKPGALSDVRNIRVLDGATELRIAARVLATWPQDGSLRSVLLQFQAPFTTSTKAFTIEIGSPRSTTDLAFTTVTWDLPTRIFTLPAAYLSESLIFWEQTPLGQSGFPAWEQKQIANYGRIETVGTANCVRDDQYYDSITSTFHLYARTGELRYLVNARRWALHHRRDQIYLSGDTVGHPRCSGAYLNNTRYTFPQGLVGDYFMFGDEEARRVSGVVVDNFYLPHADSFYYKAPNTRGWWTEREPAFALIGILAHYEATGTAAYLDVVRQRVATLHRMQLENGRRAWVHNLYDHDPSEGCSTSDYGSSPWMSGLLMEAIVKYHKLTADPIARESILMAADDIRARYLATAAFGGRSFVYLGCPVYRDGMPDLDNLLAHAFGYAYKLTGNAEYRQLGTTIFNTAVSDGYTGGAKHYNQQFRSSGHFPAYIAAAAAPPAGDTTAPTVSITAPTAGQTLGGSVTVTASASDDTGVASVQFLLDGQPYGAADASAPYSIAIDTSNMGDGIHSVAAIARDAAGNTRSSQTVSFTVSNAAVVSITSPTAGQTVSGTITATASASSATGIVSVQFLLDGQPFGAADTSAPYSVSINTANLGNGPHTVAASARDAAGNTRSSQTVSFTVNNVAPAPTVSIASPAAGQTVSGSINLTASATNAVGVQFLVDGAPYGAEVTAAPYVVTLNTTTVAEGAHNVSARARNSSGAVQTCTPVSFTVRNADVTAPSVAITAPSSGQTLSGSVAVSAAATDNVGVARVQFLLDGQPYGAEDTAAPYTVAVDTTRLAAGTHTVAARARDAAGNTATSTAVGFTIAATGGSAGFQTIRVNCGGPAYTDSLGQAWSADAGYTGRAYAENFSTVNFTNTPSPVLYRTQRVGALVQYRFAVPDGTYIVQLKFGEAYYKTAGRRIFDVSLNGRMMMTGLDVFVQAGGRYLPLDRSWVVVVTNGQIAIDLAATTDNAILSGIQITAR